MAPPPPQSSPTPSAATSPHLGPWVSLSQPPAHCRPVSASFASSTDSTTLRSVELGPSLSSATRPAHKRHLSRAAAAPRRAVALTDAQLLAIASESAGAIQWDRILRAPEPRLTRWKWLEHYGDFSLYAKSEDQRYAVLAVGVVEASVSELASLLQATTQEQHVQRMKALLEDQFMDGAVVHNVDLHNQELPFVMSTEGAVRVSSLSVKTATFAKTKLFSSHEQWCYADAVYSDSSREVFEKRMSTLRSKDVLLGKSGRKIEDFHGVVSAYSIQRESPQEAADRLGRTHEAELATRASKVHFFAELSSPKSVGLPAQSPLSSLMEKTIRNRLTKLAQSCARLPLLIRRRRLGVQVVIDQTRFLPPSNVPCISCDRQLMFAKLCRLCGHGVCTQCSRKYEREHQTRGSSRLQIENLRVCNRCIERVDAADYSHLTDASLCPPGVAPDSRTGEKKPVASVLTELLQDALLNATTREKKAAVMNVIKCVLDQDAAPESLAQAPGRSRLKSQFGTTLINQEDYVHALKKLEVDEVKYNEAPVADANGRTYAVDPTNAISVQMQHPVPENEEQRLRAIENNHIRELGKSEELSMICSMAAKELDCFASVVTIVGHDDLFIAASNVAFLEHKSFARDDTFCTHTIMSQDPLIVPHPEADVRFHQSQPVQEVGVKYYCGFPLVVDNAVVGAVCCVDQKTRELTESQYAYLKKLADTAAKVVKLHAAQRRLGRDQMATFDFSANQTA